MSLIHIKPPLSRRQQCISQFAIGWFPTHALTSANEEPDKNPCAVEGVESLRLRIPDTTGTRDQLHPEEDRCAAEVVGQHHHRKAADARQHSVDGNTLLYRRHGDVPVLRLGDLSDTAKGRAEIWEEGDKGDGQEHRVLLPRAPVERVVVIVRRLWIEYRASIFRRLQRARFGTEAFGVRNVAFVVVVWAVRHLLRQCRRCLVGVRHVVVERHRILTRS